MHNDSNEQDKDASKEHMLKKNDLNSKNLKFGALHRFTTMDYRDKSGATNAIKSSQLIWSKDKDSKESI